MVQASLADSVFGLCVLQLIGIETEENKQFIDKRFGQT